MRMQTRVVLCATMLAAAGVLTAGAPVWIPADGYISVTPGPMSFGAGKPFTLLVNVVSNDTSKADTAGVTGCQATGLTNTGSSPQYVPLSTMGSSSIGVYFAAAPAGSYSTTCSFIYGRNGDPNDSFYTTPPFSIVLTGTPLPTWGTTLDAFAVNHPVSTATGELFGHDEKADLALNSPLPFEFRRYYASYLVANGVTSALGTNWMHNFDVKLKVSGATATVQLFRGKTVTFTQSGGAWKLSSTERVPYQLVAAGGGGYQFLSADTNSIYAFDSTGALTAVQDRNGNTLTVTQAAGGVGPSQVSDGLGHTLAFTYTGSNLTKVQDNAGRVVTFEYTSGNLAAWTNANGKRASFNYTSSGGINGLMTAEMRPMGNQPFQQQFDSQGRVSQQQDSFGNAMTLAFAANGTAVTEPQGVSFTHAYDTNLYLTSQSDPSGGTSRYTYDANGRVASVTDRLGNKTTYTWDAASGQLASATDALGAVTKYTYAASAAGGFTFYDRSGIAYADGTSVAFTRDAKGNILSTVDQAGKTTTVTRNARGQIQTETNPAGGVTTLAYGSDGTLASVQLNSGDTTKYGYDSAGRVNLVTRPDGSTQQYTYDAEGNRTQNRDTTRSYDANDRPVKATDASGASGTAAYDGDDRLISVTDALGKAATQTYDTVSRLASVTDASGVTATYSYDALNRRTGAVDATGKGFGFGYDNEARLTSVTDALARKTTATRDADGRMTAVTTPLGEKFGFTYDALGRSITATDALGRVSKAQYDARGLQTNVSLPGNVTAQWALNDLGLATSLTDPNGNTWQRAWDAMGRVTSTTDPLGRAATYSYDSRQRLAQVAYASASMQVTYGGDYVSGISWSDGTSLSFTYDANHRMTGANGLALSYDAAGRMSASNGIAIARDAAGRIAGITYANGKTVQYTYDNRGLLVQVKDWVGGVTALAYDAARQLTSKTYPNGVQEVYTYDGDGRPTGIKAAKGTAAVSSVTVQRDALGRVTGASRAAAQIPAVPPSYTPMAYDAAAQAVGASYDALGRVTGDTNHTYTWDLAGRLSSYQVLSGTTSFTYDGLGGRVASTAGSVTQNYMLNYATPLSTVAVVRTGSADQRYYVWTPGGALLYMVDAATGTRHFYHFDEAGSATALTDESGSVTDTYAVAPYGESVTHTGTTDNPFTFQGRAGVMQEGATGLYYMRARYYDSGSARFLSRDPLATADPRGMSPYQFAYGNPEGLADPSGLRPNQVSVRVTDLKIWGGA